MLLFLVFSYDEDGEYVGFVDILRPNAKRIRMYRDHYLYAI